MSIIVTASGISYILDRDGGNPLITRNPSNFLPVKETIITPSSISRRLLAAVIAKDPTLGSLVQRNPVLMDLFDTSLSKVQRGTVASNFIRANPGLSSDIKNRLVSLVQDINFNQLLVGYPGLDRQTQLDLTNIKELLGVDVYNKLVEQNLVTSDLTTLITSVFTPDDLHRLQQENITPDKIGQLFSRVIVNDSPSTVTATVKKVWDEMIPKPALPVETEEVGNQPVQPVQPTEAGATDMITGTGQSNQMDDEIKAEAKNELTTDQALAGADSLIGNRTTVDASGQRLLLLSPEPLDDNPELVTDNRDEKIVRDGVKVDGDLVVNGNEGITEKPEKSIFSSVVADRIKQRLEVRSQSPPRLDLDSGPSTPRTEPTSKTKRLEQARDFRSIVSLYVPKRVPKPNIDSFVRQTVGMSNLSIPVLSGMDSEQLIAKVNEAAQRIANAEQLLESGRLNAFQKETLDEAVRSSYEVGGDISRILDKRGVNYSGILQSTRSIDIDVLPKATTVSGRKLERRSPSEHNAQELKELEDSQKTPVGRGLIKNFYQIKEFPRGVNNSALVRGLNPLKLHKKISESSKGVDFKELVEDLSRVRKYINKHRRSVV